MSSKWLSVRYAQVFDFPFSLLLNSSLHKCIDPNINDTFITCYTRTDSWCVWTWDCQREDMLNFLLPYIPVGLHTDSTQSCSLKLSKLLAWWKNLCTDCLIKVSIELIEWPPWSHDSKCSWEKDVLTHVWNDGGLLWWLRKWSGGLHAMLILISSCRTTWNSLAGCRLGGPLI